MSYVLGIPPAILNLVQAGLLERCFHDALYPSLQFRAEAPWEEWPQHSGTEIVMTRKGLLPVATRPMVAGVDPSPKALAYEQWTAVLDRWGDTIDTHMPTSAVSNADEFLANVQALGLQAGQTLNRLPRNALYKSYLSGHTVLTVTTASTDTVIQVASLNGFRDVILKGQNVRPGAVSPALPLPITINGVSKLVIGATPLNANDVDGPGLLQLSTTVGAIVPARSSVLSQFRPRIIRSGGGTSIDAISASDTVVLQDFINATTALRQANVQPHEDGFFHAHIPQQGNAQVFVDPAFQRLNTSLPNGQMYQEAFLGHIAGIAFFGNNECPDDTNSGALTTTGVSARYSEDIGAETINENGVRIGRIVVTGRGALREKSFDPKGYLTEAGVNGKVGEFQVVNAGIQVATDRIRLSLRAPQNRTLDTVSATWDWAGAFVVPSDIAAGSDARFKRAVVIEHMIE